MPSGVQMPPHVKTGIIENHKSRLLKRFQSIYAEKDSALAEQHQETSTSLDILPLFIV